MACVSGKRGTWVTQHECGAGGRKDPCLSSPQRPNATRKAMDKGLFSMMRMPSSLAVNQELALDSDGFVHSEDSLF